MENNNNIQVMDQTTQAVEAIQMPTVDIDVTANATADVVPLNYETALASYTEAERKEIIELADSIDVKKLENVMSYGSTALRRTFEQCENFLKDERGSAADQEVISKVIELSKKASSSYDDFNMVLQEPGLFQKMFLKLTAAGKGKGKSQIEKLQKSAITSYKLLAELQNSCNSWLDMLRNAMGDIEESAISDFETINLLEKYIIAGHLADSRIVQQIEDAQKQHMETGLQTYAQEYKALKEGYDTFQITMVNLTKSRVMYYLSIGQLDLIRKSNRDVQIAIHTQKENSMALVGQQLRNAILNAKTKEVLEGQKAITRLNDELIKEISTSIGTTAENAKALIYSSFYNTEAAKAAVSTVIQSCNAIEKTASEMLPKMKADLSQLNELIKELEPCVNGEIKTLSDGESLPPTGGKGNELKF